MMQDYFRLPTIAFSLRGNLAPSIEIRFTGSFTAADKLLLAGRERDSSRTNSDGLEWRATEHHVLVMKNGRGVSHVGLLKQAVRVGESMISVAGIGGVVTHPKYRDSGFARLAMEEALPQAVGELDVQFGLLFCREPMLPWYERQGW